MKKRLVRFGIFGICLAFFGVLGVAQVAGPLNQNIRDSFIRVSDGSTTNTALQTIIFGATITETATGPINQLWKNSFTTTATGTTGIRVAVDGGLAATNISGLTIGEVLVGITGGFLGQTSDLIVTNNRVIINASSGISSANASIPFGKPIDLNGFALFDGTSLNLRHTGHLIPTLDNGYTLGDTNNRWKSLWIGPGSIHMGSSNDVRATWSIDATSNVVLSIAGNTVSTVSDTGNTTVPGDLTIQGATTSTNGWTVEAGGASITGASSINGALNMSGAGITNLLDPVAAQDAATKNYADTNESNLDHGSLGGLGDDDHTQYLLTNGTRAMAFDLDMGNQSLTNLNLADGVDVVAHVSADGSSHAFLNQDVTTTGTPTFDTLSVTNGGVTVQIGGIVLDAVGTNQNSPALSLRGDSGGTEVEGTIATIYGADPYVRISVDDDDSTPALTAVIDIHDQVVAFATDNATDIGASGANRPKNIYTAGLINVGSTLTMANTNLILNGQWLSGDGGEEGVFVATDGKVGVGTATPDCQFEVESATAIGCFSDTDGSATLRIQTTINTPPADTACGGVSFRANDDATNMLAYARLRGFVADDTDTSEDGYAIVEVRKGAVLTEAMRWDENGDTIAVGALTGKAKNAAMVNGTALTAANFKGHFYYNKSGAVITNTAPTIADGLNGGWGNHNDFAAAAITAVVPAGAAFIDQDGTIITTSLTSGGTSKAERLYMIADDSTNYYITTKIGTWSSP